MISNAETLKNTTDAVVKATGDDTPATIRAFFIRFTTDQGTKTVTFDRYGQNSDSFNAGINQATSNAITSVMNTGAKIQDFTTYLVR